MPTVFNINPPIQGLNANVRSVRCWFYPSVTQQSPADELPAPDNAHFVRYEGFTQNNANGTNLGGGSIDTGDQTVLAMYQATTIQELMQAAFG